MNNLDTLAEKVRSTSTAADAHRGQGKMRAYKARNVAIDAYLAALVEQAGLNAEASALDAFDIAHGRGSVASVNGRIAALAQEQADEEAGAYCFTHGAATTGHPCPGCADAALAEQPVTEQNYCPAAACPINPRMHVRLSTCPEPVALDHCPARAFARCTGSVGCTDDNGRGEVHVYSRRGDLETCSTCAPAADLVEPVPAPSAKAACLAASKAVTGLDALHSAVEEVEGMLPMRADLLADVDAATRLILSVRLRLTEQEGIRAAAARV